MIVAGGTATRPNDDGCIAAFHNQNGCQCGQHEQPETVPGARCGSDVVAATDGMHFGGPKRAREWSAELETIRYANCDVANECWASGQQPAADDTVTSMKPMLVRLRSFIVGPNIGAYWIVFVVCVRVSACKRAGGAFLCTLSVCVFVCECLMCVRCVLGKRVARACHECMEGHMVAKICYKLRGTLFFSEHWHSLGNQCPFSSKYN